jgi:muramidase (phage lysozyme)
MRIHTLLVLTLAACTGEPDATDQLAPEVSSDTCDPARARNAVTAYQRAMLDTLATTEGTRGVSDDGYNEYFTGKLFSDCTQHPNVTHCSGNLCSTAAGRYQFLTDTWRGLGLPNFYPNYQDIGALSLITNKRGVALPPDRALTYAEFVAAMGDCTRGLALEWASLPPGCYGQPSYTLAQTWQIYSNFVAAIRNGGGGTVFELRASNGQYVSSQGGTTGTSENVYANRSAVGPWEKFRIAPTSGGFAIICQGASGGHYYVSAENGGGGAVHCNRTAIGPWETFQLVWRSGWQVAFATSNGHYLNAQNGVVDAAATSIGPAQTFAASESVAAGTCTAAEYAAQNLNGASFWTCQGGTRYVCDGAGHKVVEDCASGCSPAGAGSDDQCNAATLPACTAAEFAAQNLDGASFWTCQGTSRYVCDGRNNKVTELCATGCTVAGAGADDQCR